MSPEGDEVLLCQMHGNEYQASQPLCLEESQVDDVKEEIKEEPCEDFEFENQEDTKI